VRTGTRWKKRKKKKEEKKNSNEGTEFGSSLTCDESDGTDRESDDVCVVNRLLLRENERERSEHGALAFDENPREKVLKT